MAEANDFTNGKNILSADVEIKGSIKFKSDLYIDGKVEGEILSPGILTLGQHAEVQGEIKTKSVTVHGTVKGNIHVEEKCELRGNAVLVGDLNASSLAIDGDATLVGRCEVTPNKIAMAKPELTKTSEPGKQVTGR